MLEVPHYFTAAKDSCYNGRIFLPMLALSHRDLNDFSQHFGPTIVFDVIGLTTAIFEGFNFFRLAFGLSFFARASWVQSASLHLDQMGFWGGMITLIFSINLSSVKRFGRYPH